MNRRTIKRFFYPKQIRELLKEFDEKIAWFKQNVHGQTVRGNRYGLGAMTEAAGLPLYKLVRKYQLEILVETGVCNGGSTAFILQAIKDNGHGMLYSIDYPEIEGKDDLEIWQGKKGAVVPKDKKVGWLVPERLKDNWKLIIGKSQDKLPELLEELGEIDFFLHDSEHSYECQKFEYETAWKYLKDWGILMSDDINCSSAFAI